MPEMTWEEAIQTVLSDAGVAMHYTEISEEIAKRGLRTRLGATPHSSVNSYISTSLSSRGDKSPYLKTDRGMYMLRTIQSKPTNVANIAVHETGTTGLVRSLGMFWNSSKVNWKANPKVLGQAQAGSDVVDFADQRGIYLLHDRDRVLYVGRVVDRGLGQRLFEHTRDRLNGRWDRFSWFGLNEVGEDGALKPASLPSMSPELLIATLEAVLIEALEPPQNRKRGDQYAAAEYLQASDPELNKEKNAAIDGLLGIIRRS
jgi:hypothetical protein